MFKSAIEWSKYLNLSKVHAFLPGIKLSLHSTMVQGKIINMWSTSATILDPEVSLQLSNSVSSSKYKVLFPLSQNFTSLDKVGSSRILKHHSHTGLPYFAYASFCKDVRPFNTSGHAIFLSCIQCDEAESNCKKNKGNNSYDQVRLSFGTNLLKTKLNHIPGSPISSYSTCSSPLYFDFFVIFKHFPYILFLHFTVFTTSLASFIYQANCFSNLPCLSSFNRKKLWQILCILIQNITVQSRFY